MSEVWRDVMPSDNYQVSNHGRFRGGIRNDLIKSYKGSGGYMYVSICINKKRYTRTVHRLMAIAFLENKENKPQVNHINSIRHDNRLSNLEWCTVSENAIHCNNSIRKRGDKINTAKLDNSQVIEILKNAHFFSRKELAAKYGISKSNILPILKGNTWREVGDSIGYDYINTIISPSTTKLNCRNGHSYELSPNPRISKSGKTYRRCTVCEKINKSKREALLKREEV